MARPKNLRGRPRIDPASVAHYHLGLRFPDAMRDRLLALVDEANRELHAKGFPQMITPSSLVRAWIDQRIKQEEDRRK
jgi:hypothetical protein